MAPLLLKGENLRFIDGIRQEAIRFGSMLEFGESRRVDGVRP